MDREPARDRRPLPTTLGDEEEAWYRRETEPRRLAAIHVWIRNRRAVSTLSGNSLADDEDAWARD